jgi:hypothetical protein
VPNILGYVLYALGESAACITHIERASLAAGPGSDALAVQIRATLGQARAAAADYSGAQPLLEEAVTIKRRHRRSGRTSVGLAYALVCLASVVGDRGQFDRAHELLDGLSVVDGHGRRSARRSRAGDGHPDWWPLGGRTRAAQESAWTPSARAACSSSARAGDGGLADWRLSGDDRCRRGRPGHRLAGAARQRAVPVTEPRLAGRRLAGLRPA